LLEDYTLTDDETLVICFDNWKDTSDAKKIAWDLEVEGDLNSSDLAKINGQHESQEIEKQIRESSSTISIKVDNVR